MSPLLTLPDVAAWAAIEAERIPRLVEAGRFPAPIRFSRRVED